MENEKEKKLFEMLFLQMVMSLNEAAMIQMGKMVNPSSGKIETNMTQAQGTIDLLRMLKTKTQENLNEQEQQLLDQSIMNLELNFVDEKKASAAAPPEDVSRTISKNIPFDNEGEQAEPDDEDMNDTLGNRPGMNN